MGIKGKVRLRFVSMLLLVAVILTGLPVSSPLSMVAYGASQTVGESEYLVETTVTLDGEPIAGVEVKLGTTYDYEYIDTAITNAQGKASFGKKPALESYNQYYFYVPEGDGYSSYQGNYFSLPGKVPTIELQKLYVASATVTLNGRAASDVEVEVRRKGSTFSKAKGTTDAQGKISFGTTSATDDDYYYFYIPASDKYAEYNGREKPFKFTDNFSLAIELTEGYSISTVVKLEGKTMPGVEVDLYAIDEQGNDRWIVSKYTDTQGRVSFGNYPASSKEKYYFFVSQTTFDYAEYDGANRPFSLPGDVPAIELSKGLNITATVTLDGVPIQGVNVYLVYSYRAEEKSDANGKVTFGGLLPDYNCYYEVKATDKYMAYKSPTFKPGINPPATIPLKTGNTLSTTVTYKGKPVKDQKVYLQCIPDEASDFKASANTDENGVATFTKIPDGECFFIVEASESDEFADYDGKLQNKKFRVPEGPVPNIELEEGNTISFQLSLDSGKELEEVDITLCYWDTSPAQTEYIRKSYRIKETGLFDSDLTIVFSNLPKWNKCSLRIDRVKGQNAEYWGENYGEFFSVPGNVPDVVLEVGQSGSTRVTLNGAPQKGVYVCLEEVDDYGYINAKTDDNGIATFTNIPSGQQSYFTVDREKGRFAAYNGANEGKLFSSNDSKYPDIELKKGESFTARFLDRGKPLTNIQVDMFQIDATGERWFVADEETDQNGVATFTNVSPGGNYFFVLFNKTDESFWTSFYDGEDLPKYTLPADVTIDIANTPNGGSSSSSRRRRDKNDNSGNWSSGSYAAPTMNSTAPSPVSGPVKTENAVSLTRDALKAAKEAGSASAVVKLKNVSELSLKTAQAIGTAAGGAPVKIHADSTLMNGVVDVRLTFDPTKVTKDINLSASTKSERAKSTKAYFEKWFSNRLQAVSFAQQGSFGMPVEIAVKLEQELDSKTLCIYHYDAQTNTYNLIPAPNYWVDENGYLHFTTTFAGDILITDKPLEKK